VSVPTHPGAFTTAWLETALGAPAGSLRGFSASQIGTGQMSLSFRLALDWQNGEGHASIVAKCPSPDAGTRAIAAAMRCYALELGWYRELARQIDVACPRCLYLESNADETEFVILLQDLAPARQGDQLAGASIPQIEAALVQAAHLHAPFWASPRLHDIAWMQPSPAASSLLRQIVPALYTQFRARYAERLAPDVLELCDALVARIDAYFGLTPAALTVQHRDFRIDNILFGGQRAYVVDWQTVGPGPGASDVAYLLGTSIADADVRAREEERLVRLYVDQLAALGVAADAAQIWREYRLYAFSGVLMAVIASTNVERTARGDEMFAVMTERPARQAMHLGSLSLI
jgi:hypothetical protein